ncbi:hypothetical protein DFJ74DRAFT_729879, partial [Hyaloraphidium curvatum]
RCLARPKRVSSAVCRNGDAVLRVGQVRGPGPSPRPRSEGTALGLPRTCLCLRRYHAYTLWRWGTLTTRLVCGGRGPRRGRPWPSTLLGAESAILAVATSHQTDGDGQESYTLDRVANGVRKPCHHLPNGTTNAHNNFPRAIAFEEIRAHVPGMAPWARTMYSRPSTVTFSDPSGTRREPLTISSCAGAFQGGADAGMLFDLTNSRLLQPARDLPGVFILSISDNSTVLGHPAAAFQAVEVIEQTYTAHGMSISREQSEVFSPDPDPTAQQRLAAMAEEHRLRYAPAGFIVVGIPIGTDDFLRQRVHGIAQSIIDMLPSLGRALQQGLVTSAGRQLPLRHSLGLVLEKCFAQQFTYTAQTVPARITAPEAMRIRAAMRDTYLRTLTGVPQTHFPAPNTPADGDLTNQIFLPRRHGGLGFYDSVVNVH